MMKDENELTPEKKWEQATIANNFIFYKVMRNNPDVCKELLEILLEIKIDHIDMRQEEEVAIDYGKKAIRLDVYAVGNEEAYNLEMQATDTNELPERSRFYQSTLDLDDLNSGADYKDIKTSYIIFICVPDIFEKGLGKYKFENICIDNNNQIIKLNDRAYKLFFIAKNYDKIFNEKQKAFLELVTNNKSINSFTNRIKELVEKAKQNTQWRKQFMDFEHYMSLSFRQGKEEGEQIGAQKKAIENARKLLADGKYTAEEISELFQIPVEDFTNKVKG